MRDRVVVVVVPRADQQQVSHDDPAGRGCPARLQNHGARQVPPRRRNHDVGWPETEAARIAVQDRAEDARRVHAPKAEPLNVAAGRDQRGGLAIGEEGVLPDAGEGGISREPRLRLAPRGCVAVST